MKIAISGSHSQGKSTLVDFLKNQSANSIFKDYEFSSSMTRGLQKEGVIINEEGGALTQLRVMTKFYERYITAGSNFLHDRCALDGMAYTSVLKFQNKISTKIFDACLCIFEDLLPKYDKIFYVMPELSLVNDGVRTVDKKFFELTVSSFDFLITQYKIDVINLSGSVEERSNIILKYANTRTNSN